MRAAGAKLAAKYGIKEIGPILEASRGRQNATQRRARGNAQGAGHAQGRGFAQGRRAGADGRRPQVPPPRSAHRPSHQGTSGSRGHLGKSVSPRSQRRTPGRPGAPRGLENSRGGPRVGSMAGQTAGQGAFPRKSSSTCWRRPSAAAPPTFWPSWRGTRRRLPKGTRSPTTGRHSTGGDAEAGRRVFFDKVDLSCVRCHKVQGVGGEVGPDLTGIGKKEKRAYLLESIVDPNKQIAKGFESVVLTLTNGQVKDGHSQERGCQECAPRYRRRSRRSACPRKTSRNAAAGRPRCRRILMQKMSRTELRDLVEFLANLR